MPVFTAGCALKGGPAAGSDIGLTAEEHVHLGAIYESRGLNDLALREYDAAGEMGLAFGDFAAANIYFKQKNYDDAISGYLEAIDKDPANPAFYNNLAWVYIETGVYEDARVFADAAVERSSDQKYIYLDTAGVAYMKLGDAPKAAQYLSEAAAEIPKDNRAGLIEIYTHQVELYGMTGDGQKAKQAQERLDAFKKSEKER